ncbi:hypothetical protein LQD23_16360 [Chromobacterium violaceum]|uniref:hypothetical protein n=1 Tax=Chromobacterium violaceum TaxID=536 RepID=UPI001E3E9CB8|nr:hypothetical protein [Chromobacterium violaceum]MCD0493855.1 hypothetical protein [Chromobacterium violaceum]
MNLSELRIIVSRKRDINDERNRLATVEFDFSLNADLFPSDIHVVVKSFYRYSTSFHGIPFGAVRCERQQHIPIRDASQFDLNHTPFKAPSKGLLSHSSKGISHA